MSDKVIRDIRRRIELNEPLREVNIGQIVRGDANADRFVLELVENGQPVNLDDYSVSGFFINAIGLDVPITGDITGNILTATLGKGCYDVRGMAGGFIRVANGDASVIKTVLRFTTDVLSDGTGNIYDPDKVIGSVAELLAKISAMEDATRDARLATQEVRDALGDEGNAQITAIRAEGEKQMGDTNAAGAAQIAAIKQKGAATLETIPEDYTALENDVGALKDHKADAIICEASGEIISVDDASDMALHGLRIFGKTTQDGTPTPEVPVPLVSVGADGIVVCVGKNLLYDFVFRNYVPSLANGQNTTSMFGHSSGFIAVRNTEYTLSGNVTSSVKAYALMYDKDKRFIKATNTTLTAGAFSYAFTPSADIRFVKVRIDTPDSAALTDTQLEIGSQTDYEPPHGMRIESTAPNGLPGIPVTSGGNYTDADGHQWIADEIDFERGIYVQRVYTQVCDGTQSNVAMAKSGTWYINSPPAYNTGYQFGVLSSHHKTDKSAVSGHGNVYVNGNGWVVFGNDGFTDANVRNAELAKDPVTVKYALATPIETTLTNAEITAYTLMHTNKPNTTIYNDAGAWQAVSYAADTKRYIDKQFDALAAALIG